MRIPLAAKLKNIFCAVFRHSNIETTCFGYHYCARCGDQVGDTLASIYRNSRMVATECDCEQCRGNLKRLTFIDWFLAEKPKWLKEPPGYSQREKEKSRQAMRELMTSMKEKLR